MGNKAVFIDRDGTINKNTGYIDKPSDLHIYPGVAESIKELKGIGFKIFIITNQSGIARGFFNEEILEKIHEKMKKEFELKGAKIDAIYYCPHHPDEKCSCRKPETGLLKKAINDFDIDVNQSFIIGDRMLDIEAGYKVGCRTVLIPENVELVKKEIKESDIKPDKICKNFHQGAKWILEKCPNI